MRFEVPQEKTSEILIANATTTAGFCIVKDEHWTKSLKSLAFKYRENTLSSDMSILMIEVNDFFA